MTTPPHIKVNRRTSSPPVTVWCGAPHCDLAAAGVWQFPVMSDAPEPLCAEHYQEALTYYACRLDTDPATAVRRIA